MQPMIVTQENKDPITSIPMLNSMSSILISQKDNGTEISSPMLSILISQKDNGTEIGIKENE